jgi:hypothetical protein
MDITEMDKNSLNKITIKTLSNRDRIWLFSVFVEFKEENYRVPHFVSIENG